MNDRHNTSEWAVQLQAINRAFAEREQALLAELAQARDDHQLCVARIDAQATLEAQLRREGTETIAALAALREERDRTATDLQASVQRERELVASIDALQIRLEEALAASTDSATHADTLKHRVTEEVQERDALANEVQANVQRQRALAASIDALQIRLEEALAASTDSATHADVLTHRLAEAIKQRDALANERAALKEGHAIAQRALSASLEAKDAALDATETQAQQLREALAEERSARTKLSMEHRASEQVLHERLVAVYERTEADAASRVRAVDELVSRLAALQTAQAELVAGHAQDVEAMKEATQNAVEGARSAQAAGDRLRAELVSCASALAEAETARKTAARRAQVITSHWSWRLTAWLRGWSNLDDLDSHQATNPLDATPPGLVGPGERNADTPTPLDQSASSSSSWPNPGGHRPSTKTRTGSTVTGPARNTDELIELHDEAFVHCVYLTILGRSPDPTGFAHHVRQARSGVAKEVVIAGIARSPEARARHVELPGLAELMRRNPRRLPPLVGLLMRRALRTTLEPLMRELRSTENLTYRLNLAQASLLDALQQNLSELNSQMKALARVPPRSEDAADPTSLSASVTPSRTSDAPAVPAESDDFSSAIERVRHLIKKKGAIP